MMQYLLILCGLFYLLNANEINIEITEHDSDGYYWRDYNGVLPKDAFPGGLDVNGSTSYIAQVLYNNLLVPGELVESEKRVYYEWGFKQFIATENVKVLCTEDPEQFQWVITTNKDFKTLVNKNFVDGGHEPENRIYIGRTADGRKRLGKVQVRISDFNAILHYVEDGKGVFSESFEILAVVGEKH